MNLDYSQTAVGQTKALSEALHAPLSGAARHRHLYFPLFCSGVCRQGCERIFNHVSNRKAWLAGKILFLVLLLLVLYSVMIGSCSPCYAARFDLDFSWSLLGEIPLLQLFGLLSNLFLVFLTAGPRFCYFNLRLCRCQCSFLS